MNMLGKIVKFIFENEFMIELVYLSMFGFVYAVICIIDSFKREK